jgi:hypothetical protein
MCHAEQQANNLRIDAGGRGGCCRGSLPPAVNFYRSCVGLEWLAQETTRFILVRASEE